MTSPAIKLARECGYQHPDAIGICEDFAYFNFERYYARAQAQALRNAAEAALQDGDNFVFTVRLKQMAEELEHKA